MVSYTTLKQHVRGRRDPPVILKSVNYNINSSVLKRRAGLLSASTIFMTQVIYNSQQCILWCDLDDNLIEAWLVG